MPTSDALAAMPLYTHLDRIQRGLAAIGIGPADPIAPEKLFPLDQWHYHGTAAIAAAAVALGLNRNSRVLDIGAGIGGPARYLAHTIGCHVTAVELQPALHAIGEDLTRRCGLADRVSHVCGDALAVPLPDAGFDAAVSWLAILHMPDRPRLCSRLARAVRPGGGCYIEDLYQRAPFAAADLRDLREVVCGITVTSMAQYAEDLGAAGFASVAPTDLTDDWAPHAAERLVSWRADRPEHARTLGDGAYAAHERFYAVIDRLYASGSLGGVRLTARR